MNFWPDGKDRSLINCYWLGADWGSSEEPKAWQLIFDEFDRIIKEDIDMCGFVQKGLMSRGARSPILGYREARIYNLHQQIDCVIGQEHIPPPLRIEHMISEKWLYPNSYKKLAELF
jgi:hypothetical protein